MGVIAGAAAGAVVLSTFLFTQSLSSSLLLL